MSWQPTLLGTLAARQREVRRRFQRSTAFVLVGIDVVGAAPAGLLVLLVLPLPAEARSPEVLWGTTGVAAGYSFLATLVGTRWGSKILEPVTRWVATDGAADVRTQRRLLDAPLIFARRVALLWILGAALAASYAALFDGLISLSVGLGFGLAGLFASTVTFLVGERALRGLASRALMEQVPRRRLDRALAKRLVFTWLMSSGTGLLGIALMSLIVIARPAVTDLRGLAETTLILSVLVSLAGLLAILLVARATAAPVEDLIEAIGRVEVGQLDARVKVWDATELGVLQAGFNAMASGLEEREQLRDLFGKHVGTDVATAAMTDTPSFAGELRDVSVLFVDLIGSTSIAESKDPHETIGVLNAFFDIVIEVVHEHHGWINKFQGDAALAVWGAPLRVDDHARLALSAARTLNARLLAELPDVPAGVGVSGGQVVTGNVGTAERYEYTVIGDPVNEAARLTELAKSLRIRVVANGALLDWAADDEVACWTESEPVVLRGKAESTRIAFPFDRGV
ncbi:adenylate/guanylate cyclase domain-containing protein [Nocardioides stalactiti]|uniref:adenylate/guanylate cyclase domain-containing protein n=1 Tax=Nocardioides stalactiti TaxID=2755356 RepID=UPI0016029920|nr:adenylate/guanylate cyclase domain-containing protein [Nocardioides stalactiti]